MAQPKRKHSNTRSRTRRSHHWLKVKSLSGCSNCGTLMVPHRVCAVCGFYRGKQVLTIKSKASKETE